MVDATGRARYLAVGGGEWTTVVHLERGSRRVLGTAVLAGSFVVPTVANDGSPGGLSHDGSTLVLAQGRVRFPQARSVFAVLGAERLRVRRIVRLRGDFTFDAISPRGSSLYLVQSTSARDRTRYRVRAYDVRAGRLLRKPVVDPRERGEAMRGFPITRTASPDGRWAYTLYGGAGKAPFVHALDLVRGKARCIDLDALAGRGDLSRLRLSLSGDGRTLAVLGRNGPLEAVDTRTFRVTKPGPSGPMRAAGVPWTLVVAGAAALVVGAGAVSFALRRRRRLAVV